MRIRQLVTASFLLLAFEFSAGSSPDRNWQNAQVQQIQRVPDITPHVDRWEYVLTSNGLVYTLRTGPRDAPYLNSSLGAEVKIASSTTGSRQPYDSDEVYVLDAKGQEHKMGLVSVVAADAGCKK